MPESISAPRPSLLSRVTTALTQWIDSDYCPDGAEKMRNEPDRVDLVRVMPFVILHLACFAVIWVGWSPFAVWTAVALYFIISPLVGRLYSSGPKDPTVKGLSLGAAKAALKEKR